MAAHQAGRLDEAEPFYVKALAANADVYPALHLMGVLRLQQGRPDEALPFIERALSLNPNAPETLSNYGIALQSAGRHDDALDALQRAVTLNPKDSRGWSNRGALLQKLQRSVEALIDLNQAVVLDPAFADAWMNRGQALLALNRPEEALGSFDRVLRLQPEHIEARNARGMALKATGRAGEALAEFDWVINRIPDHAWAWLNRATVLSTGGDVEQAHQSYDRAVASAPDMPEALISRANFLWAHKTDLPGAIADLERSMSVNPNYPYARGDLFLLKLHAGDWSRLASERAALDQGVWAGKRVAQPYVYQAISSAPEDLLACAKIYTQDTHPTQPPIPRHARRGERIRVGYLCGEFRAQATMHLAVGLFERHDRTRFEVIGFDNTPEETSPMRRRVIAAFDELIPIQALSDDEAAHLIADEGVDILVNLNGHFGLPRTGVFARHPARVQVNYLGFPGTLGADYIDYILADAEVLPEGEERFYSEKVVRLPGCYQINDDKRVRPTNARRVEHGLRETDFVFCHFNHPYKIAPDMFALWMRLLGRVPGSVLWLMETNTLLASNLRREAAKADIASSRLVFAPPLVISAHLSRLALGDLFLDSLPYNAHTTASDALWAGLPLLTCRGEAFAGRVAASLLRAVNLPELITHDLAQYESLAYTLATDPSLLKSYRDRLIRDPARLPLFDTLRTTRNIEAAYEAMMLNAPVV